MCGWACRQRRCAQVASLQRDLQLAQQRGAAREQELQAELKLLAGKAEAEVKAARERGDAAQEQLRARDAELAAMRTEAALAEAAQKRLREDARREAEGHAVATRALQLEVSSAQAEAAHLAQELREARGRAEALGKALEDTQHAAQQVGCAGWRGCWRQGRASSARPTLRIPPAGSCAGASGGRRAQRRQPAAQGAASAPGACGCGARPSGARARR